MASQAQALKIQVQVFWDRASWKNCPKMYVMVGKPIISQYLYTPNWNVFLFAEVQNCWHTIPSLNYWLNFLLDYSHKSDQWKSVLCKSIQKQPFWGLLQSAQCGFEPTSLPSFGPKVQGWRAGHRCLWTWNLEVPGDSWWPQESILIKWSEFHQMNT